MISEHGEVHWNHQITPDLGLAARLSRFILQEARLRPWCVAPVRTGRELLIASDYGGSHKGSDYATYSFLVAPTSESAMWQQLRDATREHLLSDGRRMSYKRLADQLRARALVPFLRAANQLHGVLATFIVDRSLGPLVGPDRRYQFPQLCTKPHLWVPSVLKELNLIGHFGALLIAGLSSQDQDLLWVTDQDSVVANGDLLMAAGNYFHSLIGRYAPENHGLLVFLSTELNEQSRRLEDAVAIADLAAGALAETLTQGSRTDLAPRVGLLSPLPEVATKAHAILAWLADGPHPLRRLNIWLHRSEGGELQIRALHPEVEWPIPEYRL